MEKARKENFGIHAQKLPQYADEQSLHEKKYWKKQRNYFANPKHASHLQMKQDRQFWAKNDELLLNDLTLEPYSKKDAFKASYHPLPKPKDFADKALTKNYVNADKKLPNKKGKTSFRFTEVTSLYSSVKDRLFDNLPTAVASKFDYEPLYSSFNKDKIFRPPITSKQAANDKLKINERESSVPAPESSTQLQDTKETKSPEASSRRGASTQLADARNGKAQITIYDLMQMKQNNVKLDIKGLPEMSKTLFKRVSSHTSVGGR